VTVEYVVRFEDRDLVCQLVVDRTDYIEVHRIPDACQDSDAELCSLLIGVCQVAAERDAGQLLPWIWADPDGDDRDLRVCWTSPLVSAPCHGRV
jgi:hypothetical protein